MFPDRVDFKSDSDGPASLSSSQDEGLTGTSTCPRLDRELVIGDESKEPLAIVGIGISTTMPVYSKIILIVNAGCRLPGEVKSAADLWGFLKDKKSGHGKVPKERWNIDAFHHENGGERIVSAATSPAYRKATGSLSWHPVISPRLKVSRNGRVRSSRTMRPLAYRPPPLIRLPPSVHH